MSTQARRTFPFFILAIILSALALSPACSKKKTDSTAEEVGGGDGGGGSDTPPVAVAVNLTNQDPSAEITITLPYTDADSDLALSCTISNTTFVTETTPCACTNGVCTVGITHQTRWVGDLYGQFNFTVTANAATSNEATAYFTTACPAPALATGASLIADDSACPDYSSWTGTIGAGDILALQEGGTGEGGFLLAWDSNGCYKGRATSKGTPWYAVGLKVGSYGNSITTNNQVQIVMHTRVQPGGSPGVYEWTGPFSSGGSTSVNLAAYGAGGNAAKVPDDNADATADSHLASMGADSVLMRHTATHARYTTDGKKRVVVDNANGNIKTYINGVEKTECAIDLAAATGGCTNCVGHSTLTSDRIVTDVFLPQSFWTEVNYLWYETRIVDGLPRDVWGVSKFNLCSSSSTGFSSLNHSDLVSSDPSSATLRTNAVIKTRTIPNNTSFSDDLYASFGTLGQDYSVTKLDWNSTDQTYTQVCSGFQSKTLAVYQDHYDNGSTPFYGDLFTIEKDTDGIHIRKYGTTGADAGKLKKTLFTDSATPASAAAFKASTTFAGQWIVVVPGIPAP